MCIMVSNNLSSRKMQGSMKLYSKFLRKEVDLAEPVKKSIAENSESKFADFLSQVPQATSALHLTYR